MGNIMKALLAGTLLFLLSVAACHEGGRAQTYSDGSGEFEISSSCGLAPSGREWLGVFLFFASLSCGAAACVLRVREPGNSDFEERFTVVHLTAADTAPLTAAGAPRLPAAAAAPTARAAAAPTARAAASGQARTTPAPLSSLKDAPAVAAGARFVHFDERGRTPLERVFLDADEGRGGTTRDAPASVIFSGEPSRGRRRPASRCAPGRRPANPRSPSSR